MQYTALTVAIKNRQTAPPTAAGVALQHKHLVSRMACLAGSLARSNDVAAQQRVRRHEFQS